ncbi:hypothetical protein GNF78_00495 [Clostridium perfringens]|nr:hypothetical protein [Clostridium perfringens]ELC8379966.1 hypothetical protein [Clostridium perfringens]MDZ5035679.1 hypothetical protein [Clostridium perfringens]
MKTSKLITILTISVASILLSNTPAYSLENENVITPKTQEEILGTEEKLKDLDEYIKVRNSQKGYGSKKVLSSYKSVRQQA